MIHRSRLLAFSVGVNITGSREGRKAVHANCQSAPPITGRVAIKTLEPEKVIAAHDKTSGKKQAGRNHNHHYKQNRHIDPYFHKDSSPHPIIITA